MRSAVYRDCILLVPLTLTRNPYIPSYTKFIFHALPVRKVFDTDHMSDRIAVQSLTVTQEKVSVGDGRE